MSTYFQCYNDKNVLQIDDTYTTKLLSGQGNISGCDSRAGKWYGLITDIPTSYSIASGTLFILSQVLYNGHVVTYITTDNTKDSINYYQWAQASSLQRMGHGCGMEIYNSSGNLIFSSNYKTGNVSATYIINTSYTVNDGYATNAYQGIIDGDYWKQLSIINNGASVLPIISPSMAEISTYHTLQPRQYVCGYTFSNGNILTATRMTKIDINSLAGYGNIGQMARIYDKFYTGDENFDHEFEKWTGISATDYMFNIIS